MSWNLTKTAPLRILSADKTLVSIFFNTDSSLIKNPDGSWVLVKQLNLKIQLFYGICQTGLAKQKLAILGLITRYRFFLSEKHTYS